MRWFLRRLLARLGPRTIVGIATALFVLNLLIPDPLPFVDELLMLAGTILLSRWAKREETVEDGTRMKHAGRGRTHP